MSILFRRQHRRVVKRQTGGSIPFYAQYQVERTQTPMWDPNVLLQRYATADKTASAKDDPLKDLMGDFDMEGLTAEVYDAMEDLQNDLMKLSMRLDADKDYLESPVGKKEYFSFIAKRDSLKNHIANNKAKWGDAKERLGEQHGYDAPVFKGGQVLVQDLDPDEEDLAKLSRGAREVLKYINPEDLTMTNDEGHVRYKTVNYRKALNSRDISPGLIFGNDFLETLGKGMGLQYIQDKYIDPAFKSVSSSEDAETIKIAGLQVTMTRPDLQSIKSGVRKLDNFPQLQQALNGLMAGMGPDAKEGLISHFIEVYENPNRSLEVASQLANQYLLTHLFRRLNQETQVEIEQDPYMDYLRGLGPGNSKEQLKEMSDYTLAPLGLTNRGTLAMEYANIEPGQEVTHNTQTTTLGGVSYSDPYASKLLREVQNDSGINHSLSELTTTDLAKIMNIKEAQFHNGVKPSEKTSKLKNGELNWADAIVPMLDRTVEVVVVPTDENGVFIKIDGYEEMIKRLDEVEKNRQIAIKTRGELRAVNDQYDELAEGIQNQYLGHYEGRVQLRKFYAVEALVPHIQEKWFENNLNDNIIEASRGVAEGDLEMAGIQLKKWWRMAGKSITPGDITGLTKARYRDRTLTYGRAKLFIPVNNMLELHNAGATTYIDAPQSTAKTLSENVGNTPQAISKEQLYMQTLNGAWHMRALESGVFDELNLNYIGRR